MLGIDGRKPLFLVLRIVSSSTVTAVTIPCTTGVTPVAIVEAIVASGIGGNSIGICIAGRLCDLFWFTYKHGTIRNDDR